MSTRIKRLQRIGAIIWKHTSALVAVVLIVLALIVGYRMGQPDREAVGAAAPKPASAQEALSQMYTCSMHPQVRLSDPDAKCPICFMDLIPVTEHSGDGDERRLVLSEAAAKLSEIETTHVVRFFPTAQVRLYGKLTYDETSVSRITAYFPGRLDRLFVNYVGVPVARGDHVAEMYSPQLLAAFEELRQARHSVDASSTTSDIVRISTERVLDATREKLRLFGLTEAQISAAEAGQSSDDRLTVFSPITGIVTNLAAREGDYVETGSPIATVADLSRLWLDMEAYESQLPLVRWGQPVTFVVEAHPGEIFKGRIAFIEPLVDDRTRTAVVRVAVDNTDRKLKPGMFATAIVQMRIAGSGAVLSDELAGRWVGPMHPTIVKDEPGQCDICGMELVSAESLGVVGDPSLTTEPLVIPRTAALLTGARAIVYVKVPEAQSPTYEAREVMLGSRAGQFYIVQDGLHEGEEIVVKGAFRIDSAMQIAAKPSMMAPSGGPSGAGHHHGGSMKMPPPAAALAPATPDQFVFGLMPIFDGYLEAQRALAADNLPNFIRAADNLKSAIGLVDEAGLVGDPLATWRSAASTLSLDSPVTTIEDARARFEGMSGAIISLERSFGHTGSATVHIAFCPMAFDNKGAEWLQVGAEINNPYFGASMLRCGSVRESFPPVHAAPSRVHEGHRHE